MQLFAAWPGCLAGAAFGGLPSDDGARLFEEVVQEFALAAVALCGVTFAAPDALCARGRRWDRGPLCGSGGEQARSLSVFAFLAGMLAVGLVGGLLSVGLQESLSAGGPFSRFTFCPDAVAHEMRAVLAGGFESALYGAAFVLLCLLVGVYEEAFARVLGMRAFGELFRARGLSGCAALRAAVAATSLMFASLHVGEPAAGAGAVGWMQIALRFAQTFLFGVCMAALLLRVGRLWLCALVHAGFDLLYLGPSMNMDPTYGTGLASESVLLVTTTALLSILAAYAWRRLPKQ